MWRRNRTVVCVCVSTYVSGLDAGTCGTDAGPSSPEGVALAAGVGSVRDTLKPSPWSLVSSFWRARGHPLHQVPAFAGLHLFRAHRPPVVLARRLCGPSVAGAPSRVRVCGPAVGFHSDHPGRPRLFRPLPHWAFLPTPPSALGPDPFRSSLLLVGPCSSTDLLSRSGPESLPTLPSSLVSRPGPRGLLPLANGLRPPLEGSPSLKQTKSRGPRTSCRTVCCPRGTHTHTEKHGQDTQHHPLTQ